MNPKSFLVVFIIHWMDWSERSNHHHPPGMKRTNSFPFLISSFWWGQWHEKKEELSTPSLVVVVDPCICSSNTYVIYLQMVYIMLNYWWGLTSSRGCWKFLYKKYQPLTWWYKNKFLKFTKLRNSSSILLFLVVVVEWQK